MRAGLAADTLLIQSSGGGAHGGDVHRVPGLTRAGRKKTKQKIGTLRLPVAEVVRNGKIRDTWALQDTQKGDIALSLLVQNPPTTQGHQRGLEGFFSMCCEMQERQPEGGDTAAILIRCAPL